LNFVATKEKNRTEHIRTYKIITTTKEEEEEKENLLLLLFFLSN